MSDVDLYGNYPEKIMRLPIEDRVTLWLSYGEHGISSCTIQEVLSGLVRPTAFPHDPLRHDVPHDPSDFRRCYLLLKLIPEWRERLHEVAEQYPRWKPLVEHWNELTRLYEKERTNPDGNAPLLYKRMQELREESE